MGNELLRPGVVFVWLLAPIFVPDFFLAECSAIPERGLPKQEGPHFLGDGR
jgi:hypothetical protein